MDAGGIYPVETHVDLWIRVWSIKQTAQSAILVTHLFFYTQNDISDVLDLTFSIDADEEKLILYEKTEVICSGF